MLEWAAGTVYKAEGQASSAVAQAKKVTSKILLVRCVKVIPYLLTFPLRESLQRRDLAHCEFSYHCQGSLYRSLSYVVRHKLSRATTR